MTVFKALRLFLLLAILTGVIYPLSVTVLGKVFFPQQVRGDDELLAQKFETAGYFWSRPVGTETGAWPSGGSNAAPSSQQLKKSVSERRLRLIEAHPGQGEPPPDLLFSSASGLDPHISVAAAEYQARRVAEARGWPLDAVQRKISQHIEPPQYGILGEARVNVLRLNRDLNERGASSP